MSNQPATTIPSTRSLFGPADPQCPRCRTIFDWDTPIDILRDHLLEIHGVKTTCDGDASEERVLPGTETAPQQGSNTAVLVADCDMVVYEHENESFSAPYYLQHCKPLFGDTVWECKYCDHLCSLTSDPEGFKDHLRRNHGIDSPALAVIQALQADAPQATPGEEAMPDSPTRGMVFPQLKRDWNGFVIPDGVLVAQVDPDLAIPQFEAEPAVSEPDPALPKPDEAWYVDFPQDKSQNRHGLRQGVLAPSGVATFDPVPAPGPRDQHTPYAQDYCVPEEFSRSKHARNWSCRLCGKLASLSAQVDHLNGVHQLEIVYRFRVNGQGLRRLRPKGFSYLTPRYSKRGHRILSHGGVIKYDDMQKQDVFECIYCSMLTRGIRQFSNHLRIEHQIIPTKDFVMLATEEEEPEGPGNTESMSGSQPCNFENADPSNAGFPESTISGDLLNHEMTRDILEETANLEGFQGDTSTMELPESGVVPLVIEAEDRFTVQSDNMDFGQLNSFAGQHTAFHELESDRTDLVEAESRFEVQYDEMDFGQLEGFDMDFGQLDGFKVNNSMFEMAESAPPTAVEAESEILVQSDNATSGVRECFRVDDSSHIDQGTDKNDSHLPSQQFPVANGPTTGCHDNIRETYGDPNVDTENDACQGMQDIAEEVDVWLALEGNEGFGDSNSHCNETDIDISTAVTIDTQTVTNTAVDVRSAGGLASDVRGPANQSSNELFFQGLNFGIDTTMGKSTQHNTERSQPPAQPRRYSRYAQTVTTFVNQRASSVMPATMSMKPTQVKQESASPKRPSNVAEEIQCVSTNECLRSSPPDVMERGADPPNRWRSESSSSSEGLPGNGPLLSTDDGISAPTSETDRQTESSDNRYREGTTEAQEEARRVQELQNQVVELQLALAQKQSAINGIVTVTNAKSMMIQSLQTELEIYKKAVPDLTEHLCRPPVTPQQNAQTELFNRPDVQQLLQNIGLALTPTAARVSSSPTKRLSRRKPRTPPRGRPGRRSP
ncbi:hypothetical protein EDC01DRAFT_630663 [Geopyxis carbonaria]|nr:hypothetical protein EDC01DRAFT_630663 [Geopyxis carbonaria]